MPSEGLDMDPGAEGPSQEAGQLAWGTLTGSSCQAVGPSPTHPLLPITVLEVVDGAVIPVQPDAYQVARQETILCQDHKVGEEATKSLDHSCGEQKREVRRGSSRGGQRPTALLGPLETPARRRVGHLSPPA